MAHICQVHPYEVAEGLCRSCGGPFCADCLVYPFGPVKPPYCVPCAVSAAGVRTTARNPTVVVPKETKRRLKEWRKARKRDMDSPPPDGVATWQKMDEAAATDEEDVAAAQAAAEREALRLPPPQPETPTPPPGINLAPPGPPGHDWRDEIGVPASGADVAPAAIAGESALGAGWTGGEPDASSVALPDPFGAEPPAQSPAHPEPVTAYAGPAADRPSVETDAFDDRALTAYAVDDTAWDQAVEAPPFSLGSDESPTFGASFAPPPAAPDDDTPFTGAFTPDDDTPFTGAFQPDDTPFTGAFQPDDTPFTGAFQPDDTPFTGAFQPDDTPFTGAFEPTPFAPDLVPLTGELDADPLMAFGLGGGGSPDPLPPPPPAATGHAFDPLPAPLVPPPPAPVVPPHTRTAVAPGSPRLTPPPAPTRHVTPDVPRSAIRPPIPTRIPAADPAPPKTNDAKAMLARIAALRSTKTD